MIASNEDILLLQELLNVTLPRSYSEFICSGKDSPVAGLPLSLALDSVWGATEFVRAARQDLPPSYLALTFENGKALCLDLENGSNDQAPVVELDMEGQAAPEKRFRSFDEFLENIRKWSDDLHEKETAALWKYDTVFQHALQQLDWHMRNLRFEFNHQRGGQIPRNYLWRPYRFCVQDIILGITVIRHDRQFNRLEVDVFLTAEIPEYESDSGCRALALILISDAYKSGGTMEIRFTKHVEGGRIPREVVSLGKKHGIHFEHAQQGTITPLEAKQLYMALSGFSDVVTERVATLDESGRLSAAGVCYAMHHGVWTSEELEILLSLSASPDSLLTGRYSPANWHLYLNDLVTGRTALMGSYLDRQILKKEYVGTDNSVVEMEDDEEPVVISFDTEFCAKNYFFTKAETPAPIPWIEYGLTDLSSEPEDTLHVLLRARDAADLEMKFSTDIEVAAEMNLKTGGPVCILVPSDFRRLEPELRSKFGQTARENSVGIVICPDLVNRLNTEVVRRFEAVHLMRT